MQDHSCKDKRAPGYLDDVTELVRDPDPLELNHPHVGIRTTDFREEGKKKPYENHHAYSL